ncbi:hypothetical protein WJX79_010768 [Trebouxia sp. C0005]
MSCSAALANSALHSRLGFGETGKLQVGDLGSTHGTFVDKDRLGKGERRDLQSNSIISIGLSPRTFKVIGADLTHPEVKASGTELGRSTGNSGSYAWSPGSELDAGQKGYVRHQSSQAVGQSVDVEDGEMPDDDPSEAGQKLPAQAVFGEEMHPRASTAYFPLDRHLGAADTAEQDRFPDHDVGEEIHPKGSTSGFQSDGEHSRTPASDTHHSRSSKGAVIGEELDERAVHKDIVTQARHPKRRHTDSSQHNSRDGTAIASDSSDEQRRSLHESPATEEPEAQRRGLSKAAAIPESAKTGHEQLEPEEEAPRASARPSAQQGSSAAPMERGASPNQRHHRGHHRASHDGRCTPSASAANERLQASTDHEVQRHNSLARHDRLDRYQQPYTDDHHRHDLEPSQHQQAASRKRQYPSGTEDDGHGYRPHRQPGLNRHPAQQLDRSAQQPKRPFTRDATPSGHPASSQGPFRHEFRHQTPQAYQDRRQVPPSDQCRPGSRGGSRTIPASGDTHAPGGRHGVQARPGGDPHLAAAAHRHSDRPGGEADGPESASRRAHNGNGLASPPPEHRRMAEAAGVSDRQFGGYHAARLQDSRGLPRGPIAHVRSDRRSESERPIHDDRPIREGRSSRSERQSQGDQPVRYMSSRGEMPIPAGGYQRHYSKGERHASRDTKHPPDDKRHPSRDTGLPARDERRSKGGSRSQRSSSADRDHTERRKVTGFGDEATPAVAGDPTSAAAAVMRMQGHPMGTGLTLEQKKNRLWGSKAAAEQPQADAGYGVNRWDTAAFSSETDKEKFSRLMGVKRTATTSASLHAATFEDRELFSRERQDRVMGDLESQFITGLKRKDGRTVGLGL